MENILKKTMSRQESNYVLFTKLLEIILFATYCRVYSNSKAAPDLPWWNSHSNLNNTCRIKSKSFFWNTLLVNLLVATNLKFLHVDLKSSQFTVNMTVSNQKKYPDIVKLQRKFLYTDCVAVTKLNKTLGVFLFSV